MEKIAGKNQNRKYENTARIHNRAKRIDKIWWMQYNKIRERK